MEAVGGPAGRSSGRAGRRRAGVWGAAVGLAAAGVAIGVAAERLVGRRVRGDDPHAEEEFGVATYEDVYNLTYVRGPSGIIVMLAEELKAS